MKAGDTISIDFYLLDSSGYGQRYADAAAFVAAGGVVNYENKGVASTLSYTIEPFDEGDTWESETAYSLLDRMIPSASPGQYWYQCTTAGTSAASEPTWGTTVGGTTADGTAVWTCYRIEGLHTLEFTAVAGDTLVSMRPPPTEYSRPDTWREDFQSYDLDSVGASLSSAIEVPSVLSAQSVTLATITNKDSYTSPVLTIPAAIRSQIWGTTDLTGATITAAGKFAATDSADVNIPNCAFVDASAGTFTFSWDTTDTEPAASINTELGTDEEITFSIDIQVVLSNIRFTPNKYQMVFVWDRNDTA